MQFRKKTSIGKNNAVIKLLVKIVVLFFILLFLVVFVDKINFPYPHKKIEKLLLFNNFKIFI